jgi:hypothetical protein
VNSLALRAVILEKRPQLALDGLLASKLLVPGTHSRSVSFSIRELLHESFNIYGYLISHREDDESQL